MRGAWERLSRSAKIGRLGRYWVLQTAASLAVWNKADSGASSAVAPLSFLHFYAPCRQLSSLLFSNKADFHPLFDFLSSLTHAGQSLMLNERIADFEAMSAALDAAEQLLASKDDEVHGALWAAHNASEKQSSMLAIHAPLALGAPQRLLGSMGREAS